MPSLLSHDLYESSRFDLDLDPNDGGSDADESVDSSSQRLTHIPEGGSVSSLPDGAVDPSPSLMPMDGDEDVAVDEDIGNTSSMIGGEGGHGQIPKGVAMNGYVDDVRGDASSANDSAVVISKYRKVVKVRLLDAGQGVTQSSVATVAVNIPTERGLRGVYPLLLGVGQNVKLRHEAKNERGHSEGGMDAIAMTWQPIIDDKAWQPPLILSDDDRDRLGVAHAKDGQSDPPQSPPTNNSATIVPPSMVELDVSTLPATIEAKVSDVNPSIYIASEKSSAQVKRPKSFTIPSILTCKVKKLTPTEKYGLAVRKASNGSIVIDKITPGSPFAGTAMRLGYECLSINGHRLRSARRAAEIIRESNTSVTLMASDSPRPPETMYTMISLKKYLASKNHSASLIDIKNPALSELYHSTSMTDLKLSRSRKDCAAGMYFKMKHGLVKMVRADSDSPIKLTSMKAGDFILAINGSAAESIPKAVELLSDSCDDMVPILYLSMRQLRVSLVDSVIGDLWNKEWSSDCDECIILRRNGSVVGDSSNKSLNPMTIRFKEDGRCELLDPLRSFREKSQENYVAIVTPDHPLNTVVDSLNKKMTSFLVAIREGVQLASKRRSSTKEL
ncbi:hypothetical protein ACHAXA_002787 [Cyclostephanos tholiformis]|uniref:PDZ domain-containing protein n=1 Tax=Cyclostephanos tholiformis TaxID=382380 RepID=A0ABD3RGD4_9STRA